jgi:hypothetical protein
MLAATTYRLAQLTGITTHIHQAELARTKVLANNINATNGIVSPVVNPLNWGAKTPLDSSSASPEGQAFTVAMIAAHRDWKEGQLFARGESFDIHQSNLARRKGRRNVKQAQEQRDSL